MITVGLPALTLLASCPGKAGGEAYRVGNRKKKKKAKVKAWLVNQ